MAEVTPTRPPIMDTALDRVYRQNGGMIAALDGQGLPTTEGDSIDPAVLESRRFYQSLAQAGSATSAPGHNRELVPMTLDGWKQTYNFPRRQSGESPAVYRERAGIVTYYNKNELGLGRELGCSEFDDGVDAAGNRLVGIGCYVTNYGVALRDVRRSLRLAVEGEYPKNTVCITYRPSMDPGYEVQFQVYGPQGIRQDWAQLDTLGPRANPHVCMNCHGGAYDEQRHLAKFARFLPMDPNVVIFAEGPDVPAALTRAGQEERVRRANALALRSPITPGQREMLTELYGGHPERPGTVSQPLWYPPAWREQAEHRDMFDQVLKPYCLTCHMAMQKGLDGSDLYTYGLFSSPAIFRRFPLDSVACGKFSMPNAQTTSMNFWDPSFGPVVVAGRRYPTAADALLGAYGHDRTSCQNLDRISNCDRKPDPDSVCGNAFSGTACVRSTGRCVPVGGVTVPAGGMAVPAEMGQPTGVCRMDGSRSCPYPLECRPGSMGVPGLDSFDGVCVFCGQAGLSTCTKGAGCAPGMIARAGICRPD